MIYNKVYAQIGEERHIVLDPINYQYDVKQILVISGETVPEYYEADICNVGDTATLTMIGTAADGVEIPDKFLLDGRNVLVYVVIPGSGGDVQTRYDITIPVDERAEREDIDPSEAEQQQIDSLIAALNSGVGRAEAAVTHYPKIVDGYWTVWNAETETWVNTGIRAEGRDGYSPEVTITEIEGGHRVTITDEDHPQGQTFDVMDGQGGSTGDYDELTNRPRINGHTLTGNQSASDLELGTYSKPSSGIPKTDLAQDVQQSLRKADTALQTAPVQSVAGKTGAVNLGAEDIGFNSSEEYNEGTVGAELSELNRHLSDLEDTVSTTQIINTASGAIASFDDGADEQPIRKLVAQIEPVQDLHGYDHPWPAGGNINKFSGQWPPDASSTYAGWHVEANTTVELRLFDKGNGADISGLYFGLSLNGTQAPVAWGIDAGQLQFQSVVSRSTDTYFYKYVTLYPNNEQALIKLLNRFDVMVTVDGADASTFAPYSNICPISGHTGAEIEQTGGNVWDEETELGYWNVRDGSASGSTSELRSKNFIPVTPNTQYYFNKSTDNRGDVLFFGKDQEYLHDYVPSVANRTFTTPDNCYYIKINFGNQYGAIYNHDVSINYPATDTNYHPYTGNQISVNWENEAGTVYGGTLDVTSGVLTVDRGYISIDDSTYSNMSIYYPDHGNSVLRVVTSRADGLNNNKQISNYGKYAANAWQALEIRTGTFVMGPEGNVYLQLSETVASTVDDYKSLFRTNPFTICYELATPQTYQLTPQEITTLLGQNNIWSSTGDTEVEYPCDTKLYIDRKITQAIANALNS